MLFLLCNIGYKSQVQLGTVGSVYYMILNEIHLAIFSKLKICLFQVRNYYKFVIIIDNIIITSSVIIILVFLS